jgi:hypothetical protein
VKISRMDGRWLQLAHDLIQGWAFLIWTELNLRVPLTEAVYRLVIKLVKKWLTDMIRTPVHRVLSGRRTDIADKLSHQTSFLRRIWYICMGLSDRKASWWFLSSNAGSSIEKFHLETNWHQFQVVPVSLTLRHATRTTRSELFIRNARAPQ